MFSPMYTATKQTLTARIDTMLHTAAYGILLVCVQKKLLLLLRKSLKLLPPEPFFDSNMHQIVCRLGFSPDPTYSALPDPLAGLEEGK